MVGGQRSRGGTLEMWVTDEHRVGLQPLLRRVWALRGQRPIVPIWPRYEWLYIYAFAHPPSGRAFFLLMPSIEIVAFNLALQEFAAFVQPSPLHQVLILLDNASYHSSPKVQRPAGLDLRFLPAYSPELQPAEHLWQFTDKPLVNRWFKTLDELESVLVEHCSWLQHQHALIRSATLFDWWPTCA